MSVCGRVTRADPMRGLARVASEVAQARGGRVTQARASYTLRRSSLSGAYTAAPAGLTCLNDAAAGRFMAARSSRTCARWHAGAAAP